MTRSRVFSPLLLGLIVSLSACTGTGTVLETRQGKPSGSGGADGNAFGLRSGTRVALEGYFADDALIGVRELRDKKVGGTCQLGVAEDGVERCLPSAVGGVFFRDAACQEPIVVQNPYSSCSPSTPLPPYLTYKPAAPCPEPRVHVVSAGAPIERPPKLYEWGAVACQESALGKDSSAFFEAVTSPAANWVAFQREVAQVTPELGVERWVGEDGSRIPGSLTLSQGDVQCEPMVFDSGATSNRDAANRCVPIARFDEAGASFFADGACTVPVAQTPDCRPLELTVALDPSALDACGRATVDLFAVGSVISNASVYTNGSGVCQAGESLLGGMTTYRRGAAIDVTRYPLLQERARGTGQIQAGVWQSGGQWIEPPLGGVDAKSGEPCAPTSLSDGTQVCEFSAIGMTDKFSYFADDACTSPLYPFELSSPPCGETLALPRWVSETETTDSETPESCVGGYVASTTNLGASRSVLDVHAGPVYGNQKGACSLLDPAEATRDPGTGAPQALRDLGEPIDTHTLFHEVTVADL